MKSVHKELVEIISLKLSQMLVDDSPDKLGYTKSGMIAEAILSRLEVEIDEEKVRDIVKKGNSLGYFELEGKPISDKYHTLDSDGLAKAISQSDVGTIKIKERK